MPVIKNDYPILEYDTQPYGIIKPERKGGQRLPEVCVMTFFEEVLAGFIQENSASIVGRYPSEMRDFPAYSAQYKCKDICLIQAAVGSASAAMMAEYLIGYGVKTIILCGGCGVLSDIPAEDVIIPVAALRDEGASYHYLPPAREIELDAHMIAVLEDTLVSHGVPFVRHKTWTTDAFYRETPDMIAYRKAEGCGVVEMECAAVAAVARLRGASFGQLLYSGDSLFDTSNYDERNWSGNITARKKLFLLALETAVTL